MNPRTSPPHHPSARVLFVRRGPFSGTNFRLLAAFRRRRPDVAFEDLDVDRFFSGRPVPMLRATVGALSEYGLGTFRSRTLMRYRMTRNSGYFATARTAIREWLGERRYACSVQTQSLFDASSGRFPNLVYTDGVARARETAAWTSESGLPSRAWLACETDIYRNAERVFTFGTRVRRMLVDLYGVPEDKAVCAGGGASVSPESAPPTDLGRYARRSVLFVGVDWVRKGGPDLLAAFRLLRARLPDATLTIVGCSPPEVDGIEGCTALGRLPPEAVAAQFEAASCFCMPSRYEPFGLVYLEAARFALPVVATTVGDIGDMVHDGENGWRVAPGDVDAIAEALLRVLEDPATAQRMGAAGAALSQNWTWDAVADRILACAPLPMPA